MKTETTQSEIPAQPGAAPVPVEIPLQTGIGSIVTLMLTIVFARLILGQSPTSKP
jgi:hypothetical protein